MAVCAITLRRPEWLERLLKGAAALTFRDTGPDVRVVIVENEADGPGKEVCDRLRPEFPFPLEHYVEPRRGIPFARNAAIERAAEVDFIAFIDDDEVPDPGWLDELLRVQSRHQADLIAGPVVPRFEQTPPTWIVRGGFCDRLRMPTGTSVLPMGTGNLLIRRQALAEMNPPFDERLALTGGSDTHFFQRMKQAGKASVWADEAVVHEWVPTSRMTARWIASRAVRTGVTFSWITRDLEPLPKAVARILWRSAIHVGWGLASLPINLLRGRHSFMLSVKYLLRGLGMLGGLFGYRYEEYRRIHGK
ncbi:MAG: glycosyltransferase family A protein [Pirellulales bacterium]